MVDDDDDDDEGRVPIRHYKLCVMEPAPIIAEHKRDS